MTFKNMHNPILHFLKKDVVLFIALFMAAISCFFTLPNYEYINYIDFRVLALLFSLMAVVSGMKSLGLFNYMGEKLCSGVHTLRGLYFALVGMCFFSSMFITNDVALITFVPFSVYLFNLLNCKEHLIKLIILETIAANLGSMLTPIGNPQNLYLYSLSGMSFIEFVTHMLPLAVVSAILLIGTIFAVKPTGITDIKINTLSTFKVNKLFIVYICLFFICMGDIFHILSYKMVFLSAVVLVGIFDRKIFKEIDYSLLLTFICFFVFIGNIGKIDNIRSIISSVISTNVMEAGIISSQFISNVPAAMLLSEFTEDYSALLWGVNIGGLGTLIASLASIISYKYYINSVNSQKGKYILTFVIYNLIFLAVLWLSAYIMA